MVFLPKNIENLYKIGQKIGYGSTKGRVEYIPNIIIDYSQNQPKKFQIIAD